MITIVEPKDYIDKLWGKQRINKEVCYRLMQYVISVKHDNQVLLHNVVTGQLVVLAQKEAEVLSRLPAGYSSEMNELIVNHYFVPIDYDEHDQVVKLRSIFRKLDDANPKSTITNYTILPTTACNARCYYCFEKGTKFQTMTKETADDVVNFIVENCGAEKSVVIAWFGGEPTVATERIDQICEGLRENGITYRSSMITNGYLFDEEMVLKAKQLWNLKSVQITIDGTEKNYNRIKAYPGVSGSPYQRVMRNIGLLLDKEIVVGVRMNYDLSNYMEFTSLVEEVITRFGHHKFLGIGAHPIIGEHENPSGVIQHGTDEWFLQKQVELEEFVRVHGQKLYEKKLPYLNFEACAAYNDAAVTIAVDGGLVRCPEKFGKNQYFGTVRQGIFNRNIIDSWKEIADFSKCKQCTLFPNCVRLVKCSNTTYCHKLKSSMMQYQYTVKAQYSYYKNSVYNERGRNDDISRAES